MSVAVPLLGDAALPGLGLALDRAAFLELLSEQLPECRMGTGLVTARIENVHYSPGVEAHVLWKITASIPESSRKGRQLIVVRVLRGGEAMPEAPEELIRRYGELRAHSRMALSLPLRTPWLPVASARLVIHAFPLDPDLPTLLDVTDPRFGRAALHQTWRSRDLGVTRVAMKPLAYTPGARVALRFDVTTQDRASGAAGRQTLVGKLDVRKSPTRIFAGHWAVWNATRGAVSIPVPAGYLAVSGLSLQEFVAGTRLSDLAGGAEFLPALRQAARSIARIHSHQLPLLARRTPEKEMASVDRWTGVLAQLRPAFAGRIERLRNRLARELAQRMRVTGAVHADFHLANMLAHGDTVSLIDWDQTAHGDAMVDVGRVLASLRVASLRVHGTVDGLDEAGEDFLQTYLRHSGDDVRRARLFESASLLIAAAAPFRLQRPHWEEGAEGMLEEVERALDLSQGVRIGGSVPASRLRLPLEEQRRWATEPPYAQALLVPVVHETFGAGIEVTECSPRVLSAPDDRVHVRWRLKGYRGSERWYGTLEGFGSDGHSGHGLLARLQRATAGLEEHPTVLRLPIVAGHLASLAMIVVHPPPGEPLNQVLTRPGTDAALATAAAALAGLNALDTGIGKERETARTISRVQRCVERLERNGHARGAAAAALLEQVLHQMRAVPERRGTVPEGLRLRDFRMNEDVTSAAVVTDLVTADPLVAVGNLLAELHVVSADHGAARPHLFRTSYAAALGVPPAQILPFEILAMLGDACRRFDAHADSAGSLLLARAAHLLETQS